MVTTEQTAAGISYCTSLGCVIGGGLEWLAPYAAGLGVVGIVLTYITNLYFKIRRDRRERERLKSEVK